MVKDEYFELLKTWCDGLLRHQLDMPGQKRFDGALLCPACTVIHGRCHDAVYPLLYMADATGEMKYKEAALRLFDWGENMVCDDGSFYNDAQSEWNGITVFGVISICDSLREHGHLLDEDAKKRFEERMRRGAEWIYRVLTPDYVTNINYNGTAAAAMALTGDYFNIPEYLKRARELAKLCMDHITEDGLLYGEGMPREEITKRGCRPVDIGYNVEETAPSLLICARVLKDAELLEKVRKLLECQLEFMLPDGAWDNSFGSRNFKWTYWGSRTSDGCQTAYGTWGGEEPVFQEAALRNLNLYRACTHDGLLYGGPDYWSHGEEPCIHHTFCHAKALAAVLDCGGMDRIRVKLPIESGNRVRYFPTIDTYKISFGGFLSTLTGYDFEYMKGGHASGGCVTLLWHEKTGPVLVSSMTAYSLKEAHNMQLSVKKSEHRPLTMRVETEMDEKVYSQFFDYGSEIQVKQAEDEVYAEVKAELVDIGRKSLKSPVYCRMIYTWNKDGFQAEGWIEGDQERRASLIIPVIGRHGDGYGMDGNRVTIKRNGGTVEIESEHGLKQPAPVFFLAGGFEAWELVAAPDRQGHFRVMIKVL
ncbi:hypothetical protein GPL15_11070 [Clostridium sp. MCC353]|uniref:hypothetical protein n=1 Tax=Clostridium sp. MCC353 TaxID=2592646 RepID=UPI001C02ABD7|nr:hypothetical protein [Clostridium sp. MCC353]MBT9777042.1 hypothetical protein [Clostridium sp. MCC353]